MGSSPRASDTRIILSAVTNGGLICAAFFTIPYAKFDNLEGRKAREQLLLMVLGVAAFIASHNIWFGCGLKKPFKGGNEQSSAQ
jgi:hypothetical protein